MTTITARNQAEVDARVPEALRAGGEVELRIDPMEGPVDFISALNRAPRNQHRSNPATFLGLARVTVRGGSSPVHLQWVRDVRDQCKAAGMLDRFRFEGWGESVPLYALDFALWNEVFDPEIAILYPFGDDGPPFIHIGSAHSGRMLDGRTHAGEGEG